MRKLLILGAVLAAVAVPSASHAQGAKFTLGARLGYGAGIGDVAGDGAGSTIKMSDWVTGQVPLQLDALYRITPEWAAGVYLSYGVGVLSSTISDQCTDCTASDTRIGVQATYSFVSASPGFVPWLGLGLGYEWNKVDENGISATFSGMEWFNLQGGADWKLGSVFALGPYVMYSMGQYSSGDVAGVSGSVVEKKAHSWLGFGVRGKFDL